MKKNNFLDIHINGSLFDSRDCGNYFLNDNSHMFDIKCYSENSEDYCELDEFKLTYD